jgi:hypothetical protein
MFFLKHFDDLRLDIVGIVAVLGEGSVTELARITSLSWHHILPRLMPAPQALLNLRHDDHLPFAEGITISVSTAKLSMRSISSAEASVGDALSLMRSNLSMLNGSPRQLMNLLFDSSSSPPWELCLCLEH